MRVGLSDPSAIHRRVEGFAFHRMHLIDLRERIVICRHDHPNNTAIAIRLLEPEHFTQGGSGLGASRHELRIGFLD